MFRAALRSAEIVSMPIFTTEERKLSRKWRGKWGGIKLKFRVKWSLFNLYATLDICRRGVFVCSGCGLLTYDHRTSSILSFYHDLCSGNSFHDAHLNSHHDTYRSHHAVNRLLILGGEPVEQCNRMMTAHLGFGEASRSF